MDDPRLTDALVTQVLRRWSLDDTPPATRAGLASLYGAWCANVPWDNVQKRITVVERRATLAGSTPAEFFENHLRDGTGGTCWPGGGALHALLMHLGFPARRAVGSMAHDASSREVNHGTTIVRLDGEDLIVDSSILHGEPLALRDGASVADPSRAVRVERSDGRVVLWWTLHSRDEEMACVLLEDDVPFSRYLERYEASRATGFSYFLTLTKRLPGGVLAVNGTRRSFRDATGAVVSETMPDRSRVLTAEAGLSAAVVTRLPADEPDPNRPLQQAPVPTVRH